MARKHVGKLDFSEGSAKYFVGYGACKFCRCETKVLWTKQEIGEKFPELYREYGYTVHKTLLERGLWFVVRFLGAIPRVRLTVDGGELSTIEAPNRLA